jgi:hypothetical protein
MKTLDYRDRVLIKSSHWHQTDCPKRNLQPSTTDHQHRLSYLKILGQSCGRHLRGSDNISWLSANPHLCQHRDDVCWRATRVIRHVNDLSAEVRCDQLERIRSEGNRVFADIDHSIEVHQQNVKCRAQRLIHISRYVSHSHHRARVNTTASS